MMFLTHWELKRAPKLEANVMTYTNNIPNRHVLSGDGVSLKLNTWSIKLQMLWINSGGYGAAEPWWKLVNVSQFHTLAGSVLQCTQISSHLVIVSNNSACCSRRHFTRHQLVVKLLFDCWRRTTERKKEVSPNSLSTLSCRNIRTGEIFVPFFFCLVLMSKGEQGSLKSGQI